MKKRTLNIFIFSLLILMAFNFISATSYSFEYKLVPENAELNWYFVNRGNDQIPECPKESAEFLDTYDAYYVGDTENKIIYLTFDEGYEAGYTEKFLEILKKNEVKATFFITAHYVNTQPDLVKKMLDDGHIVGNHTVNHKSMPDLSNEQIKEEVMNLHKSVYEKFGYEMKYIRPPKGEYSERTIEYTNTLGYKTVMWSFAYDDWDEKKQGREEYAKDKILKNIHNGAVMLLHGNSKDNVNVLDYCIKEIKKMGYEFKTLDEFIR